jgi:hypothetical protein
MKTREEKLAAIDASMKRWLTRNKRATNALSRLAKQRDRLLKPRDVSKMSPAMAKAFEIVDRPKDYDAIEKAAARLVDAEPSLLPHQVDAIVKAKDGLDLPGFLARGQAAQKAVDKVIADLPKAGDPGPKLLEDLLNPAAAINRKRLERNDAKRRGVAKPVDKKAMPLSGREALRHIKSKK